MDQELKEHLEAIDSRMVAMETRLVTLIIDVKESMERQMLGIADRLDMQAQRLDRQAALIQTGARWTTRMGTWSEKVDVALEKHSQQIGDLRNKIDGGPKQ